MEHTLRAMLTTKRSLPRIAPRRKPRTYLLAGLVLGTVATYGELPDGDGVLTLAHALRAPWPVSSEAALPLTVHLTLAARRAFDKTLEAKVKDASRHPDNAEDALELMLDGVELGPGDEEEQTATTKAATPPTGDITFLTILALSFDAKNPEPVALDDGGPGFRMARRVVRFDGRKLLLSETVNMNL